MGKPVRVQVSPSAPIFRFFNQNTVSLMPQLSFPVVISAVLQIFLIGSIGFFLIRRRVMDENGLTLLATLAVNLFYPLFAFSQLTRHFSFSRNPDWGIYPLICVAIGIAAFLLARAALFLNRGFPLKKEFTALVIFNNCGYIPLLLTSAVFEGEMLRQIFINIFLYCMGFDIALWTIGVGLLAGQKQQKSQWRSILNPPILSILAALGIVYFGWQENIPAMLSRPVEMIGQCALPIGMIIIGGNLAAIKVTDARKRDIFFVILAKLILLPVLATGAVLALKLDYLLGFLIVLQSATPSAINLSVIARHYRGEEKFINQAIFFTHLFSMASMPFFLIVYTRMMKGF